MTKQPLPSVGSTSWYPWANDVDTAAGAVLDGRLTDASLTAELAPGGTAGNINQSTAAGIAAGLAIVFGG